MKPRIAIATYCIIGVLSGILAYDALIGLHVDRRFVLYGILQDMSLGTSRQRAEAIIAAHTAPFLHRHATEHGEVLRVNLGLARSCLLTLSYSNDKIIGARIRSEDGSESKFSDAPPDI